MLIKWSCRSDLILIKRSCHQKKASRPSSLPALPARMSSPGIARRGHSAVKPLTSLPEKPWNHWWAVTDSNRRHPACKADALPAELTALREDLSLGGDGAQGRAGTFKRRRRFRLCRRAEPGIQARPLCLRPRPVATILRAREHLACLDGVTHIVRRGYLAGHRDRREESRRVM
jgi:hypothetical protein